MKDSVTSVFADALQTLISDSGMKINDLSAAIGISSGSLSKYQNDAAEPGITALVKIADYFHVSIDYLLGRSKTPVREHEDLMEQTGLSKKSVATLASMNKEETRNMCRKERFALDILLSHNNGTKFLKNLYLYLCTQIYLTSQDPEQLTAALSGKTPELFSSFYISALGPAGGKSFLKTDSKELNELFFIKLQQNLMELKKEVEQNGDSPEAGK